MSTELRTNTPGPSGGTDLQ